MFLSLETLRDADCNVKHSSVFEKKDSNVTRNEGEGCGAFTRTKVYLLVILKSLHFVLPVPFEFQLIPVVYNNYGYLE